MFGDLYRLGRRDAIQEEDEIVFDLKKEERTTLRCGYQGIRCGCLPENHSIAPLERSLIAPVELSSAFSILPSCDPTQNQSVPLLKSQERIASPPGAGMRSLLV